MKARIYLLIVELVPEPVAEPVTVTVDTTAEDVPDSRPVLDRPGLRKCRAVEARGRAVAP